MDSSRENFAPLTTSDGPQPERNAGMAWDLPGRRRSDGDRGTVGIVRGDMKAYLKRDGETEILEFTDCRVGQPRPIHGS